MRSDKSPIPARERNRLASRRYRARKRPLAAAPADLAGEQWRDVLGMEGVYAVSSLGRVKYRGRTLVRPINTSDRRWPTTRVPKIRKQHVGRGGYLSVGIRRPGFRSSTVHVHVLICEAFHGPRPDGMMALHENDERHDNREENLYWGTPKQNAADAARNGRLRRGPDHPNWKAELHG